MKNIKYLIAILTVVIMVGCEKQIEEEVFSQINPEMIFSTREGIESVLFGAYAMANYTGDKGDHRRVFAEWPSDIELESGGWVARIYSALANFTLDANIEWLGPDLWNAPYSAINNANVVLENLPDNLPEEDKKLYTAEARFIRAETYYMLYKHFGPVPLKTKTTDMLEMPRCSEEEIKSFIETELTAIIPDLPAPGTEVKYGRAHKAAAMGFLCKYYLNTKQWQKAADMATDIINLNYFELYPIYWDMFKTETNGNKEMVWAYLSTTQAGVGDVGCYEIAAWFPPGFAKDPITGLVFSPSWQNWASQYRLRDNFFNSFEDGDLRKLPILTSYINKNGDTISLLNNNNTRSFKFHPDPNGVGRIHGNDIPAIRYADILLSRAEALNELNGPTQDALDLINDVRSRAGVDDLQLADFTSKDQLRDHILLERSWEFYGEGLRREDLIRHGKFIESALERGATNAKAYHVLFPIPQTEIDANSAIEQNPGY